MGRSTPLNIAVLGGLEVTGDKGAIKLPSSRKTRALLAYLLLTDRPQRRDHLCDLFWPDGADDPRAALRWSLSKLRPIIDGATPRLIAGRETVSIDRTDVSVDLHKARALLDGKAVVPADLAEALTALRQPLLAGLDPADADLCQSWITTERHGVERLRRLLLGRLVQSGGLDSEDRLPWAREWLDVDPFNPEAALGLRTALLQLGRVAEAEAAERDFAASARAAGLAPCLPQAITAPAMSPDGEMLLRQKIQFTHAADGVRLAWAAVGEGPPLVKAANWLNHLELDWQAPIWAPMFQELARDHTFIRYDERGNGLSDGEVDDISFDAFVHDLETVVDAAGIDRFPLLGLSQGCAVAVEYAVRHPERVSHLILWGGYAAGWRIDATPDLIAEREAIITLVRQGWGRTDAVYRQMVTATFMPSATPDELESFNSFQRDTVTAENAARYLEVFADIDVRHRLGSVRAPTLVMHARGDRRIALTTGVELAACIPGAEFVALESDNHLLLGREPASQAFVAHIRQFLGS